MFAVVVCFLGCLVFIDNSVVCLLYMCFVCCVTLWYVCLTGLDLLSIVLLFGYDFG